jgi:hypothetical protein
MVSFFIGQGIDAQTYYISKHRTRRSSPETYIDHGFKIPVLWKQAAEVANSVERTAKILKAMSDTRKALREQ